MSIFKINYNPTTTTAISTLSDTNTQLTRLKEQISTGVKINNAADDPSIITKSQNLRTLIAGTVQIKANTQNTINYVKTVEVKMNEIRDILHTARTFTLQVLQNDSLDDEQITALNAQVQNAVASVNNISQNSTYGDKKILDSTAGISAISTSNNTNHISIAGYFNQNIITPDGVVKNTTITTSSTVTISPATPATIVGDVPISNGLPYDTWAYHPITVNGYSVGEASVTASSITLVNNINSHPDLFAQSIPVPGDPTLVTTTISTISTGSSATLTLSDPTTVVLFASTATAYGTDAVTNTVTTTTPITTEGVINLTLTTKAEPATITGTYTYANTNQSVHANGSLTINGTFIGSYTTTNHTVQNLINDINNKNIGLTATLDSNQIVLTSDKMGSKQSISLIDTGGIISNTVNQTTTGTDAIATVNIGNTNVIFDKGSGTLLKDTDGNKINLTTTGNNMALNTPTDIAQIILRDNPLFTDPTSTQRLSTPVLDCSATNLGFDASTGKSFADVDISTKNSAADSLNIIDQSLNDINNRKANLGNIQKNILEPTLRSLSIRQEKMEVSDSDLCGLNMADAMAQLTKLQIITQSTMAQLAQANQAPAAVLHLLRH